VRPIAIVEVWVRLASLCAMAACQDAGPASAPLQLWVSVPAGSQSVGHALADPAAGLPGCVQQRVPAGSAAGRGLPDAPPPPFCRVDLMVSWPLGRSGRTRRRAPAHLSKWGAPRGSLRSPALHPGPTGPPGKGVECCLDVRVESTEQHRTCLVLGYMALLNLSPLRNFGHGGGGSGSSTLDMVCAQKIQHGDHVVQSGNWVTHVQVGMTDGWSAHCKVAWKSFEPGTSGSRRG
jgi:hypothetical protein